MSILDARYITSIISAAILVVWLLKVIADVQVWGLNVIVFSSIEIVLLLVGLTAILSKQDVGILSLEVFVIVINFRYILVEFLSQNI